MVDVVVCGHICVDLIPNMGGVSLDALSSPGKLFEVDHLEIAPGGAVSNTGLALHKLGVAVGLMGKVGGDLLGRVIVATLSDYDPALADMITTEAETSSSYSIVLSPAYNDRIFLHCTGTNDTFGVDDVNFGALTDAKIFHLGYPPLLPKTYLDGGEQLAQIFQRAKTQQVVTSMDTAQPDPNKASGQADWQRVLATALPHVDVFLPSLEEIVFMLRRQDYDKWDGDALAHVDRAYLHSLAGDLLQMGVAVAGFKMGHLGIYLRTTDKPDRLAELDGLNLDTSAWLGVEHYQPAFAVDVVGTTGAGDAAYGAFLAGMARGLAPSGSAEMACAVGASNAEQSDSVSGVQSWEATRERVAAGWPTHDGGKALM